MIRKKVIIIASLYIFISAFSFGLGKLVKYIVVSDTPKSKPVEQKVKPHTYQETKVVDWSETDLSDNKKQYLEHLYNE